MPNNIQYLFLSLQRIHKWFRTNKQTYNLIMITKIKDIDFFLLNTKKKVFFN